MSDDIVVVLDALGEDDFYYRPATTKAMIDKAAAEIARLRAALTTARREGMETIAGKIAGWHEDQAMEYEAQARKFEKLKTISDFTSANPAPDGFQYAVRYAEGAAAHRQRAAAIRAAAKEEKP